MYPQRQQRMSRFGERTFKVAETRIIADHCLWGEGGGGVAGDPNPPGGGGGGVFIIGGGGGGAGGGANPGLGPGAEPRGGAGGGWLGLTTLDLLSPALWLLSAG